MVSAAWKMELLGALVSLSCREEPIAAFRLLGEAMEAGRPLHEMSSGSQSNQRPRPIERWHLQATTSTAPTALTAPTTSSTLLPTAPQHTHNQAHPPQYLRASKTYPLSPRSRSLTVETISYPTCSLHTLASSRGFAMAAMQLCRRLCRVWLRVCPARHGDSFRVLAARTDRSNGERAA